jgi:uncharacterized membrane protein
LAPLNLHLVAKRWPRYGLGGTLAAMNSFTTLTPVIAIHMSTAILAVLIGPWAIWARKGSVQRPKLHRAFGYAWVTCMLIAAISAIWIRSGLQANLGGFSAIHLLIPFTLVMLFIAFRALAQGNIRVHRTTMVNIYIGACLVAGFFTLAPKRFLGNLIWHQWLGWV